MKVTDVEEFFLCACHSPEHQVLLIGFASEDERERELYLTIHLSQYKGFFGRLWGAIKYIFGYRSKYGDFDTWLLRPDDAERFKAAIDKVYPPKEDKE
jgi:hypothetical protein